jgi:hypothetical protein
MPKRQTPPNETWSVEDHTTAHYTMIYHAFTDAYLAKIGPYGISVYLALRRYANAKERSCFPALPTLARLTGISRRQVIRSLAHLVDLKLIAIRHRGVPRSNAYVILDPPAIVPTSHDNSAPQALYSATQSPSIVPNRHVDSATQSPEVYPPKNTQLKKTHPTPPAPKAENVVEVGAAVAIAQGEETTATDGGIGCDAPTPFDEFFVAYPSHRAMQKARKAWGALGLDAMLSTILQALSWQKTLTGNEALPLYPHVYLQNKGWLDARPASPSARPHINGDGTVIYPADDCCEPECHEPIDRTRSDKRCKAHVDAGLREEAEQIIAVYEWAAEQDATDAWLALHLSAIRPPGATIGHYHEDAMWPTVQAGLIAAYRTHTLSDLDSGFVVFILSRIVEDYRGYHPKLAVVN